MDKNYNADNANSSENNNAKQAKTAETVSIFEGNTPTEQDQFNETRTDDILDIINKHHRDIQSTVPSPAPDPTTEVKTTPKPPVSSVSHKPAASSSVQSSITGAKNTVSLDDFTDASARVQNKNNAKTASKASSSTRFYLTGFAKVFVYLVLVFCISIFISITAIKVGNDIFAFVKEDKEVTIVIPKGATTEDVAQILKDNGIIEYPKVYKMYTAFRIDRRSYLTGEYKQGEVVVNPMLNYDQLLETLSVIKSSNQIVRITIPEGYSISEIIELFKSKGMQNTKDMEEIIQNFEYDYQFTHLLDASLEDSDSAKYRLDSQYGYRLEGYLFPDTYDFYVDENAATTISKLLDNFNLKFDRSFYERATELGLSVDEVITLASLIEAEGNNVNDYAYISSVFHNRMNHPEKGTNGYLQSDATVQYALGTHKSRLEANDTDIVHPYNTYKVKGLPPGPICNPGYEAIYAALYPEKTDYYYFITRSDGVTKYSRTYDQHMQEVAESNRIDAQKASNQ